MKRDRKSCPEWKGSSWTFEGEPNWIECDCEGLFRVAWRPTRFFGRHDQLPDRQRIGG